MKYFLKKYRVLKQFCNKFTYNFVFTYALIFSLFSSCVNVRLSFHFTALLLWMLSSLFYPKIFVLKKFVFLLHLYILKYNVKSQNQIYTHRTLKTYFLSIWYFNNWFKTSKAHIRVTTVLSDITCSIFQANCTIPSQDIWNTIEIS